MREGKEIPQSWCELATVPTFKKGNRSSSENLQVLQVAG